ncbi:hypothetical protein PAXRUDRAFT_833328 [Paxillus rubicundulus Ve08.2h10]|uniref:Unplaced genomic scaffold scaffold_1106, whole genome shotgun sequence n=1 Tax=Paxillus rubicundulus Ve08.2h10 TaxID=930991 RepID=A0A0D0DPF3_9AGAM|nr:hypothetical protein PAXRUDRAFT_833328 [Paxillus rubicundulus Ve08.2h10]
MSQLCPDIPVPCSSLPPKLRTLLTAKTDRLLLRIIRANFNTQYASQAPSLAGFRDVVSAHGTTVDGTLLQDFRGHVLLMDYESYKPFVTRFNEQPCKESEVENLFAPGLPFALAMSSSTSGNAPKMFAKYHHIPKEAQIRRSIFDRCDVKGPENSMFCYGYKELKEVERECDQVVKRIPVSIATCAILRMAAGWNVDSDKSRMLVIMPGQVSPWAASMINNHRSFLMVQALFCLACRDLDRFTTTFCPLFLDLIRYVGEEWDMFLSCIKDGTIPDLEGIDHLQTYLQVHLHANPERAAELREIGPPFSCAGWAARVWPKLTRFIAISSGPFATVLPQVRSILGPTIALRGFGYGATECVMAASYDMDDLDTFVIQTEDVIEFLDVTAEESHENILQAWELEVGKQYQIVLTTRDGLWRYLLGDVVDIVGFDSDDGSPVIKYLGRQALSIRFPHVLIPDSDLVAAIQAISSEDIIQVHEFTAMVDDRTLPPTVGCFVEGQLGPNSHLAPQKLFNALVVTNHKHQDVFDHGHTRLPTIRIVRPGTFTEYRLRRGEKVGVGAGQTKVPVVLLESAAQEWIKKRVVQEL